MAGNVSDTENRTMKSKGAKYPDSRATSSTGDVYGRQIL